MRLSEILNEDSAYRSTDLPLSNFRGPYNPQSDDLAPYGKEYDDASDLWDIVDELIDTGIEPSIKDVSIDKLLATQDWLSTEAGDGPMWDEYEDYPVVLDHDGQRFILDGHNRISKARQRRQPSVKVYYFLG